MFAAVAHVIDLPSERLIERSFQDALHIPAFFAIATGAWLTLRRPGIVLVMFISLAIGSLYELAQLFTQRNASFLDLSHDAVGAAIAVCAWSLYQKNERLRWLAGGALLVMLLTLVMPLRVLLAYQQRDAGFPRLLTVDDWRRGVLVESNSDIDVVKAPPAWSQFANQPVLQVRWSKHPYPGLQMEEVVPDWSHYETLVVEAFNPERRPMLLTVAVRYAGAVGTSAYVPNWIAPGPVTLRVPLKELLNATPQTAQISVLILHTSPEFVGSELLMESVRLE